MPKATQEKVEYPTDARGLVFEPIDAVALPQQRNVHVVLTAPGGIRGNHFHQYGSEITVLIGPALVRVRENGIIRDFDVPAREAWRFTFPPGVSHAFQNTGAAPSLAVAFNTSVFDKANPDVTRDVLI